VTVLPIAPNHREQVIGAVGNRLLGLGVELSDNLRRQLADPGYWLTEAHVARRRNRNR
jgi:hypothetical protein